MGWRSKSGQASNQRIMPIHSPQALLQALLQGIDVKELDQSQGVQGLLVATSVLLLGGACPQVT